MKKIIGLLMVCAIFGMIFMGCQNAAKSNDATDGSGTTKFEGRWKAPIDGMEVYFTFKGNSCVQIATGDGVWGSAAGGTFTFTNTEMTITATHGCPEGSYPTEAVAIAAMTAVPAQRPTTYGYILNTEATPNTCTLTIEEKSVVYEKQ